MRCRECAATLPAGARVCPSCGTPVAAAQRPAATDRPAMERPTIYRSATDGSETIPPSVTHERRLRSTGEQLAAWGFEPEAAHARQWQAASEIALGHRDVAIALLEAVRPVWQRLRARPAGEACERLLVAARQLPVAPAS